MKLYVHLCAADDLLPLDNAFDAQQAYADMRAQDREQHPDDSEEDSRHRLLRTLLDSMAEPQRIHMSVADLVRADAILSVALLREQRAVPPKRSPPFKHALDVEAPATPLQQAPGEAALDHEARLDMDGALRAHPLMEHVRREARFEARVRLRSTSRGTFWPVNLTPGGMARWHNCSDARDAGYCAYSGLHTPQQQAVMCAALREGRRAAEGEWAAFDLPEWMEPVREQIWCCVLDWAEQAAWLTVSDTGVDAFL